MTSSTIGMEINVSDKMQLIGSHSERATTLSPLSIETEESWTDAECHSVSSKKNMDSEIMEKVSKMVTELELIKVNMQCMLDQTLQIFAMLKERPQN